MANIVLSYSKIKFWIGSILPCLFTFHVNKQGSIDEQ